MSVSPKFVAFGVVAPALFGFDFASKAASRGMEMGERWSVIDGWFAITHAENPYVAFSMPVPYALIVSFAVVGVVVLVQQLWVLRRDAVAAAAGLAAMASGALGNLVDRVVDGTVTDMFMLYTDHPTWSPWLRERFGTSVWPIFNVADVALLVGVGLFLVAVATEPDAAPVAEE